MTSATSVAEVLNYAAYLDSGLITRSHWVSNHVMGTPLILPPQLCVVGRSGRKHSVGRLASCALHQEFREGAVIARVA